jgi:type II secretory pathway component GspD/PulD (secretin)
MARIEELLEMIDVPGEPRKIVFRQLQYTVASAVLSKVKTLADKLRIVPITISAKQPVTPKPRRAPRRRSRRRRSRRRTPVKTKKPVEKKKGIYLNADDRTNRIVMIGSQEDIDTVNSVINTLDARLQDSRIIKEYKLENISAEEAKDYLDYFGVNEK